MNQFKFGDHVKHPKYKGKLIFIESFEEVNPLKKEWAEVLSEEAGDFVFVPLEELEPTIQEAEIDNWLSVAYNPPPVGVWLLGQDKLGQVGIYSLVQHGRTKKLHWHDGTRYREEDTIVYWQLLPKPRKEASW